MSQDDNLIDFGAERARRIHDSHLARARWMTEHGYRQLAHEASAS